MPLISIIVPCYNCDKYIERCIVSLTKQTYSNFEIIAVNDGSTDNTLELLNGIARTDTRLRVITQDNAGVSAARNRGIEEARGRYVVFCDADDFVEANYIADFINIPYSSSSLLIQYPMLYDESTKRLRHLQNKNPVVGIYNIKEGIIKANLLQNGYPFGKLFDTAIVRNHSLQFRNDISYKEDLIFNLEYLQCVNSIVIIPGSDYRYCKHPNSLSSQWRPPEDVIAINTIIETLLDKLNIPTDSRTPFEEFCVGETLNLMYNATTRYKKNISALSELRRSMRTDAYLMQTSFDKFLKLLYLKGYFRSFDLFKRLSNVLLKLYSR